MDVANILNMSDNGVHIFIITCGFLFVMVSVFLLGIIISSIKRLTDRLDKTIDDSHKGDILLWRKINERTEAQNDVLIRALSRMNDDKG